MSVFAAATPRQREAYDQLRTLRGYKSIGNNQVIVTTDMGDNVPKEGEVHIWRNEGTLVLFKGYQGAVVQDPLATSDDMRTAYFQIDRTDADGRHRFPIMSVPMSGEAAATEVVDLPSPVTALDVSPDGQRFAVIMGHEDQVAEVHRDGTIRPIVHLSQVAGLRNNRSLLLPDEGRFLNTMYLNDGAVAVETQISGPMIGTIENYYVADKAGTLEHIPWKCVEGKVFEANLRWEAGKTGFLKEQPIERLERFAEPYGHGCLREHARCESPDGNRMAFLVRLEQSSELWVFPMDKAKDRVEPRLIATLPSGDSQLPFLEWSRDSRSLTAWPKAEIVADYLDTPDKAPEIRWDVETGTALPVTRDDYTLRALGARPNPGARPPAEKITVDGDYIVIGQVRVPKNRAAQA